MNIIFERNTNTQNKIIRYYDFSTTQKLGDIVNGDTLHACDKLRIVNSILLGIIENTSDCDNKEQLKKMSDAIFLMLQDIDP